MPRKSARSYQRTRRASVSRRNASFTSAVACSVWSRRSRAIYARANRRSSASTSGVSCSSAVSSPSPHARSNAVTVPDGGVVGAIRTPKYRTSHSRGPPPEPAFRSIPDDLHLSVRRSRIPAREHGSQVSDEKARPYEVAWSVQRGGTGGGDRRATAHRDGGPGLEHVHHLGPGTRGRRGDGVEPDRACRDRHGG